MTHLSNDMRKSLVLIHNHLDKITEHISIITLELTELQHGATDGSSRLEKLAGSQGKTNHDA